MVLARRIGQFSELLVKSQNESSWIGASATTLIGVTVGENAIMGAGAVVTNDVEFNTVIGGIPAKPIKKL